MSEPNEFFHLNSDNKLVIEATSDAVSGTHYFDAILSYDHLSTTSTRTYSFEITVGGSNVEEQNKIIPYTMEVDTYDYFDL